MIGSTQQMGEVRWKIEEVHRELKQLTGVQACQCRKARILTQSYCLCPAGLESAQSVALGTAELLVYQTGKTIYQLKHGMLSDYLMTQLKHPSVHMVLA